MVTSDYLATRYRLKPAEVKFLLMAQRLADEAGGEGRPRDPAALRDLGITSAPSARPVSCSGRSNPRWAAPKNPRMTRGFLVSALLMTSPRSGRSCRPGKASDATTLSDLGITRDQSSQWQKLAAVPEAQFETALAGPEKATTAGIIARNESSKETSREATVLEGRMTRPSTILA